MIRARAFVERRGRGRADGYSLSAQIIDYATDADFQRAFIGNTMTSAGMSISGVLVGKFPFSDGAKDVHGSNGRALERRSVANERFAECKSVLFEDRGVEKAIKLSIDQESAGVCQLFCLSAPTAQALEFGSTLPVSEIDLALHPILAREIIRCFPDPGCNRKIAQLVFIANDPFLLEKGPSPP